MDKYWTQGALRRSKGVGRETEGLAVVMDGAYLVVFLVWYVVWFIICIHFNSLILEVAP